MIRRALLLEIEIGLCGAANEFDDARHEMNRVSPAVANQE